MLENNQKDRFFALIAALGFHLLVFLAFLFLGLSTPLPLPEEEGVLVALGYVDEGTGRIQPLSSSPPAPRPEPTPPATATEEVVVQTTEESVAMPDARPDDTPEPETESPPAEEIPVPEAATEEPPQEPVQQVDPRALFPGADQRATARQDQGDTTGEGDRGRREGAVDAQTFEGLGQSDGIEFTLTGRTANFLPIPDYTTQAQGRVVVAITVDRQGQVVRARAGDRGTTTSDQVLWRLAEEAARRARFDIQANAPEEQSGTITYNFIRRN